MQYGKSFLPRFSYRVIVDHLLKILCKLGKTGLWRNERILHIGSKDTSIQNPPPKKTTLVIYHKCTKYQAESHKNMSKSHKTKQKIK